MGKYPMIKVVWHDAKSHDEWVEIKDTYNTPVRIVTLGFLIHDTDEAITVAQNYDNENDSVSMTMTIPNAWIESIDLIEE